MAGVSQSTVKREPGTVEETPSCVNLPYDVWELIGNYVNPESIATFGSICKDSYTVINQPSFWLQMYRNFCISNTSGEFHHGIEGLNAKVIRLLYLHYTPFQLRLASPKGKVTDPHTLIGLICLKHHSSRIDCPPTAEYATGRVHFDIKLGKVNPSLSLWRSSQVIRSRTDYATSHNVMRLRHPL